MAKVRQQRATKGTRKRTTKKKPAAGKRKTATKRTSSEGFRGKSPLAAILYGPSGVGKTSFAANFPDAGFVYDRQEEGIVDLVEFGQAPEPVFTECVESYNALLRTCENIASGKTGIQTAVFDSFTGFEKLIFVHHCDKYFDGDWSSKGFYSYMQGPKNAAKTDLPQFLDALEDIRAAGINVILIAHSEVKPYNNPEGSDYDRFVPVCDKSSWQQIHRWSKAVLFYNYFVEIETQGPRAKANTTTEQRYIYTEWSPAYDAKNRYGLEPLIDAGESGADAFQAFAEAFDAAGQK